MAAVARSPACAPVQAARWPQVRLPRPARGAAAHAAKEEAPTATLPPPPAAAAATAPPAAAASPADRKYLSLLPPFFSRATRLEEYGPGLWGLVQPLKLDFAKFDIQLRMVATCLPDGSLLLVSPIAPTAEALSLLAGLGGRVSHIVLPSSSPEHWFYGPALSNAFPDATVWVVPGLLEGKGLPVPFLGQMTASMRPRCKALGVDQLPAELQGQVESELLTAPFFIEAAVVLPQHGALLLADTGFKLDAAEYGYISSGNIAAAEKAGVWDRLGPITRIVFEKYPKEGRAWCDALLAKEWHTVIPAHASAPVRDGRAAFKSCFDFLYN
jgi:hypothetical protein